MFSVFTHDMKPVRDTVSLGHLCLNLERGETAVFAGDKKAWCTCKVIVLQICCFRPVAFSPFSLPSLSSLLKLPNLSKYSTVYLPPFLSQRRENFVLRVSGFFVKDPIKSVRRRPKISEDAGFRSVPNDSVAVLSFQNSLISGESTIIYIDFPFLELPRVYVTLIHFSKMGPLRLWFIFFLRPWEIGPQA